MKKYIQYKIEAGGDFINPIQFKGFITYFDGRQIVITSSSWLKNKGEAWQWIAEWLRDHEIELEVNK